MVLMLAALALTQEAVEIKVRPTPRMVLSYEMKVDMSADGSTVDARMFLDERFHKQEGKTLFWDVKTRNVIINTTGNFKQAEAGLKDGFDLTGMWERDDRHRVQAITIEGYRVPLSEKDGTSDVVLPSGPVKPGAKWPGNFNTGSTSVKGEYVYIGPHSLSGQPTYLIEFRFNDKNVTQIKPYQFHVAQADGRTVLASGHSRIVTNGITIEVSFTMRRTAKYTAPS